MTMMSPNDVFWNHFVVFCEYLYLILAISGLFLNLLSLIVLASKSMRGRTNLLLALIAVFDMVFLCLLTLNFMPRYPIFVRRNDCNNLRRCLTHFYVFYMKYKTQLTMGINFCSTTSTWLVVLVCLERCLVIKKPFKTHAIISKGALFGVVSAIIVFSFGLSVFHNFSFEIVNQNKTITNITGINNGFHSMSPSPNLFWIQVAATIGICFQVVVPLFLLTFTNGLLLFYLKTRNKFFQIQKWNPSKNSFDSSNALESDQDSSNQKSKIWSRRHLINERRITITVFSIVCCFVITNLPSSFIVFWFYIIKNGDVYRDELDYAMVLAAIIVVVIGKAANFFLLCHSSANFRRQLKHKFLDPFRIFLRLGKSSIPLKNPIQPQIHYAKLDKIEIQC